MIGLVGSPGGPQRIPVSGVDRLWRNVTDTVTAVGPLADLDQPRVRAAVRALADLGPQTKIGLTLEPSGRAWRYDPGELDRMVDAIVSSGPAADPSSIDEISMAQAAHPDPNLPLRVVVAGDWLLVANHHMLGDGHQVVRWLSGIASMAQGGPLPEWTTGVSLPRPLPTALRRTFGSGSGRLAPLLRTVAGEHRDARIAAGAQQRAGSPPGSAAAPPVAWRPDPFTVTGRSTAAARDRLRDWARVNAPTAAAGPLLLAAIRLALSSAGVAVAPSSAVAVDARRYLPRGAQVHGNFVSRTLVTPARPDDPESLTTAVREAADSGRPLAALTVSTAVTRARRASVITTTTREPGAPASVGFSWLGRPMALERLSWAAAPDMRHFTGCIDPGGPNDIGIGASLLGGGLNVMIAFHRTSYDTAVIRAALAAVLDDPAAVLEAARA